MDSHKCACMKRNNDVKLFWFSHLALSSSYLFLLENKTKKNKVALFSKLRM